MQLFFYFILFISIIYLNLLYKSKTQQEFLFFQIPKLNKPSGLFEKFNFQNDFLTEVT